MAEPSRQKQFTVSIIGGGLAGLLLAIGLSTRSVRVQIYEAAPCFAETSAGIGFGPNAVRAMTMLDPRIRQAYELMKTENGWERKKNTWFDFRTGWGRVPELITELKMGKEGGGNLLRATFMDALVNLLPEGCAVFGKSLRSMEESVEGVNLLFDDGTMAIADAVVGCDGIRSVVRKIIFQDDNKTSKAVFSGVCAYRGLLNMEVAISAVGEELALNSQVYIGKDRNLVTYPIEEGSVLNVVAFRKHKEDTWNHPRWVTDSSGDELLSDFQGWGEVPLKIINLMKSPQIWALFEMPPTPNYSSGRITLLGDAAHASTSHAGAGAGMAVEDAFILSELISDSQIHSILDLPTVFAVYNNMRQPRTQRLVQHSRQNGNLFQLRKPGVEDDIEKVKADLVSRQQWIWDIDLDEHLKDARIELSVACNRS